MLGGVEMAGKDREPCTCSLGTLLSMLPDTTVDRPQSAHSPTTLPDTPDATRQLVRVVLFSWVRVLFIFSLHIVGIYIFTRGFLLNKFSLSTVAPPHLHARYCRPTSVLSSPSSTLSASISFPHIHHNLILCITMS